MAYSKTGKSLEQLLSDHRSPLAHLMGRADELLKIEQVILDYLPEDVRPHCRLGTVRGTTLILQTESSVWATRIRFQEPMLLKQLNQDRRFAQLKKIQTQVRPTAKRVKPPQAAKPLSADSAAHVEAMAEGLGDDELGLALRRLAERGSKT